MMFTSFLVLFLFAVIVNIPMGYLRENHPKFSFKWFLWIHASIPFLIYLRLKSGISPMFIPLSIFFAIAGQMVGSRIRKKQMNVEDQEQLNQIPDLNIKIPANVKDEDVMVVLMNMGGPKTLNDIKNFQMRLFSDSKLIRFPLAPLLQKFFAWLIVTLRLKASQHRYQLIGGGSPIFASTEKQVQALQKELRIRGRNIQVTFSFNYSEPLSETTIKEIITAKKKYILPLSLYPQYSKATTGSNLFYLKEAAQKIGPSLEFLPLPSYYLHESYIQGFVDRIKEQIKPGDSLDDFYLIFSAHGLPLYFLTEGDPYAFQVSQTVAKVLGKLGRNDSWTLAYQSAVGPFQWLYPYTDKVIEALVRRGIKKMVIVPIAFVTDHIETTCELDIEYRKIAEDLGVIDYRMSRALECHSGFINALADSVESTLIKKHQKLDTHFKPREGAAHVY